MVLAVTGVKNRIQVPGTIGKAGVIPNGFQGIHKLEVNSLP